MRAFACPVCNEFVAFENDVCDECGTELGMHLPTQTMIAFRPEDAGAKPGEVMVDGVAWTRCANHSIFGCNWLAPADGPPEMNGRCLPGSMIRNITPIDDLATNKELGRTTQALRRLIFQLADLNLPIEPFWQREGGLGFDLLSSESSGEKVIIGHTRGIITIDLDESMDDYRVAQRVKLGEAYRTMLGHFRHEAGHYYQHRLVESGPGEERYLADCREIFGDEQASYADALERHYSQGPPRAWQSSYISEYATMHPWEDFAECFAHYLHITDTMDTAREAGMVLHADRANFNAPAEVAPLANYDDAPIDRLLFDWKWMSLFFNRVNASMGKGPLYPFELPPPVVEKLGFVHRVLRDTAREHGK